jgi:molecular chaperone HtpG
MRADLKIEAKDEDRRARDVEADALGPLFDRMRAVLGGRVSEVRSSDRLTDSPCCLVLASGGPHGYVERLLREAGREVPKSARIFEVNPTHPVTKSLVTLVAQGDARVADWIELLYGQALVAEGAPLDDPSGFARRLTSLLSDAAASKGPSPIG